MTLENQALHLENERLRAENAHLTAEVARLDGDPFGEIGGIVSRALGRPIEPGHTAVYAVELLVAEAVQLTAQRDIARHERDRAQSQRDAMRSVLDQVGDFIASRQALAMDLLASPGEGGGA